MLEDYFFFSLFRTLPAGESLESWLKECVVHNYLEKQSGLLTPVTKCAIHNIRKDKMQYKCFKGSLNSFNFPPTHCSFNQEARKTWDSTGASQAQSLVLSEHQRSCGGLAGREQTFWSFLLPSPSSTSDLSLPTLVASTRRSEVTATKLWDQRCSVSLDN